MFTDNGYRFIAVDKKQIGGEKMRNVINMNRDWRFIREDAGLPGELPSDWKRVDLPHTWNAVDGHDGNGGYYRGKCWYAKSFETPGQPLAGGKVYVEIQIGRAHV